MDIKPTNQQSLNDDQELAKVLAGITDTAAPAPISADSTTGAATAEVATPKEEQAAADEPDFIQTPTPITTPAIHPVDEPPIVDAIAPAGDLDGIKQDALKELRPLVDKLDVSPDERFDTYLLLLRSTDDSALIAPAFAAARSITDEARRAQALLDVIKEIDYLSNNKPENAA